MDNTSINKNSNGFGISENITSNRGLFKRQFASATGNMSLKKFKVRETINKEVFDIHDSVADLNKTVLLMISMLVRFYNSDFDNSKLSVQDKAMIEYAFDKFINITNRLDLDFVSQGGFETIDKLLEAQQTIAEIINKEYNIVGEDTDNLSE